MPITVRFRGPMLFVTDTSSGVEANDKVNRVVIPDATGKPKHDDGSEAVPHFAGVLVIQPGGAVRRIALAGRTVEIVAEGEDGAPGVDSRFLAVPPIHKMTNPPGVNAAQVRRRADPRSASTVTFRGGSMSGELINRSGIELGRHKAPPLHGAVCSMPVWRSDAAKGSLRISGGQGAAAEVIPLDAGVQAYVYNWDTASPLPEAFSEPIIVEPGTEDGDFKWVYDLLTADGKSWTEWLEGEPSLPAPRRALEGGAAPGGGGQKMKEELVTASIDTCNSARYTGPVHA